jgi:hypothetical protein
MQRKEASFRLERSMSKKRAMKKTRILSASLLSIVLLSFIGCQKAGDETGHVSILVTDAPFPLEYIEEATVTITRVELRKEGEEEEHPFITVCEGSEELNLLDLRNGIVQELAEVEVPAGAYNLIRMYVEEAGIVVKDYGSYSVKVPSGSQTGIKLFIAPSLQVSGGLTTEVLLDFNLEQSFVLKGNLNSPAGIKGFNFKPVIRAENKSTTGTIYGIVSDADQLPVSGATLSLVLSEEETLTTSTEGDGSYAFIGIPAGTYPLTASQVDFEPLSVEEVLVVAGNKTRQDFVLEPEVSEAPAE